jgi:hypothetical protein
MREHEFERGVAARLLQRSCPPVENGDQGARSRLAYPTHPGARDRRGGGSRRLGGPVFDRLARYRRYRWVPVIALEFNGFQPLVGASFSVEDLNSAYLGGVDLVGRTSANLCRADLIDAD